MQLTPRPYSLRNPEGIYFVTFAVVFWLDVFVRERYKSLLVQSLNYCVEKKGLRAHAWCLMTSHVHLIISAAEPEKVNLSAILRDLKKFTAAQIIREIEIGIESRHAWLLDKFRFAAGKNSRNTTYQFWQQDNHAEELISNAFTQQKLDYIHANPVVEGWVEEASHYRYSSARDYSGGKGLVPISFLE